MPSPKDLHLRFAEHLRHTELAPGSQDLYVRIARGFGTWLRAHPQYADALIDVEVRDRALAAYWRELQDTRTPTSLRPARVALTHMFHWLQLPPGQFPVDLRKSASAVKTHRYGNGTWIAYRDGVPFKAKAICVDGRLRTTDRIRPMRAGRSTAALSLYTVGVRFRISGSVFIETATGELVESPGDPLVVKFEAHEKTTHADLLGLGRWVA